MRPSRASDQVIQYVQRDFKKLRDELSKVKKYNSMLLRIRCTHDTMLRKAKNMLCWEKGSADLGPT